MINRRQMLQQTAAGLAGLPILAGAAESEGGGNAQEGGMSQIERNKRIVRAQYEAMQHEAIPSTLPGVKDAPPMSYGGTSTFITNYDPPDVLAIARWHAQSTAPAIHSYGPMIAEGDAVVEEWETFFHGLDGTMYSNHYCWIKQIKDGKVAQTREYVDSHHVVTVFGSYDPRRESHPSRAPRRRGPKPADMGLPPLTNMETVFPIRREFNLPPSMLRDVTPTANAAGQFPDTLEGNKALIQAMRNAQAKGDAGAVDGLHAKGFRHFVAGEGPLGWEHVPFQDLYAPLVTHLKGPLKVRFSTMVAEGDSVFEEMDCLAHLDDGTVYNNWHCFIHQIRDGRIVQTREYMDSHHLWVMLGRWADWGKTPVPPMRHARRSNLPYVTATVQVRNPYLKLERWEPLPAWPA
ncbi:MAG TPA: nuclear transport factor 2 family protein [Steroidobacteraceae bacterium]